MKEKLEVIREALRHAVVSAKTEGAIEKYVGATSLVNALIAELDKSNESMEPPNIIDDTGYFNTPTEDR